MNSKEENFLAFYPNYVQEFGLFTVHLLTGAGTVPWPFMYRYRYIIKEQVETRCCGCVSAFLPPIIYLRLIKNNRAKPDWFERGKGMG